MIIQRMNTNNGEWVDALGLNSWEHTVRIKIDDGETYTISESGYTGVEISGGANQLEVLPMAGNVVGVRTRDRR